MTATAFFDEPVRFWSTIERSDRELLDRIVKVEGKLPGRVLGDALAAEAQRLGLIAGPVSVGSYGTSGSDAGPASTLQAAS